MSAGQWLEGWLLQLHFCVPWCLFKEKLCVEWHQCAGFPLPWLSLAWGIATSNMCEPGKWVSSANWKSILVTHFLHKTHIIFKPLFTMGSLSLGGKQERRIICVKAKQKKKKSNEKLLLQDAWNGRARRLLSLNCKMISRCHKPLCEMKVFNRIIPHLLCYTWSYGYEAYVFTVLKLWSSTGDLQRRFKDEKVTKIDFPIIGCSELLKITHLA